jgi:tungstate transport system ATP-binding protein
VTPSPAPSAPGRPAVSASGLTRKYGKTTVLSLDGLELPAGRIHVLVGPNGAGKTTAMRVIAGLEPADGGELEVLGSTWKGPAGGAMKLRRRIGFAAQKPYLFSTTVRRNVEYPLRARGVPAAEIAERSAAAMRRLGVAHLADRNARTLSAGEGQRVAIARATVARPDLLLLDEPLANLDPESAPIVESLCRELAGTGVTVLIATHVLEMAYHLSAEVVRLEKGRLMPPALDNLLSGEVTVVEGGEPRMTLGTGLPISVATEKRGPVRAAINPGDILLSSEALHSSARNSLPGRVTALEDRGTSVRVTADVGVKLVASVTHQSVTEMRLTIGSPVYFTFKATALRVF